MDDKGYATISEIRSHFYPQYLSNDAISKVAYGYWERDEKPDGEKYDKRNKMKIKDVHWLMAEMMLECLLETDVGIYYDLQFNPHMWEDGVAKPFSQWYNKKE